MSGRTGLSRFVGEPAGVPAPAAPRQPEAGQAEVGQPEARQAEVGRPEVGRAGVGQAEVEKCEMCATVIPETHGHVADLESASLMCACRACYLLFTQSQAGRGRYRTVPDRYLADPEDRVTVSEWDTLDIPVGLVFFLRAAAGEEVTGFYPSPAGATECRLDLTAWQRLAADHPLLREAEADVEAVLMTRSEPAAESATGRAIECFIVPIDACYELAGRMRLHWRGFDGGSEARASIAAFLDGVRERARPLRPGAHKGGA